MTTLILITVMFSDDAEPGCSNDLGQARQQDIARERIRTCHEERRRGQSSAMGAKGSKNKNNEIDEGERAEAFI